MITMAARLLLLFLVAILRPFNVEAAGKTKHVLFSSWTEICADETLNIEFCPLRPSILSTLDHLHNEAYHVCEEDIIPPCTETLTLKDKQGSPKRKTTTTTVSTTTLPSTTTISISTTTNVTSTTTPSLIELVTNVCEKVPEPEEPAQPREHDTSPQSNDEDYECPVESASFLTTTTTFDINRLITVIEKLTEIPQEQGLTTPKMCDEDRSRCDLSIPVLTTPTTFLEKDFLFENTAEPERKEQSSLTSLEYINQNNILRLQNGSLRVHESDFLPDVIFDTLKEKPKQVQTSKELKDQLHLVKESPSSIQNRINNHRHRYRYHHKPHQLRRRPKLAIKLGPMVHVQQRYGLDQQRSHHGRHHSPGRGSGSTEIGSPAPAWLKPVRVGSLQVHRSRRVKRSSSLDRDRYRFQSRHGEISGVRAATQDQHQRNRRTTKLDRDEYISNSNDMDASDEEKLTNLYGKDMFDRHRTDFARIENMKAEHVNNHGGHAGFPFAPIYDPTPAELLQRRDQARLQYLNQKQRQLETESSAFPPPSLSSSSYYRPNGERHPLTPRDPITPAEIKQQLKELLEKIDAMEVLHENEADAAARVAAIPHAPLPSPHNDRCTLSGLWLSTVTGVGIQLEPMSNHDLSLKVIDFPEYRQKYDQQQETDNEPVISSEWTGRAVVSTESATTISIVLQEKWVNKEKEPRTAVFVGQCVICSEAPTIQGTWILFPDSQTCYEEIASKLPPKSDIMFLVK